MINLRRVVAALVAAPLAALAFAVGAVAATPATVTVGAVGALEPGSVAIGAVAPTAPMALTLVLAPRDPAGLAALASGVSTPGSPDYHRYLTVPEFAARFGAGPASVAAVTAALLRDGLTPGALAPDGLSLSVSGDASAASHAFGISLRRYRERDGQDVFANTAAPRIPAALDGVVSDVLGLDDVTVAAPAGLVAHRAQSDRAAMLTRATEQPFASGGPQPCSTAAGDARPDGPYTINEVADAYGMGDLYADGDLGSGVTVALLELESYSASDISAFQSCFGTDASVTAIPADGGPGSPSGSDPGLESALDIENAIGTSPASTIDVYQGPNTDQGVVDTLQAIVDGGATVISDSWGLCESATSATLARDEGTLFQEAATAGQTVLVASGDLGSSGCSGSSALAVDDPASQPWATGVGGTTMSASPASQTVWDDGSGASGGGISTLWPMPSYQTALAISANSSKTLCQSSPLHNYVAGSYCREVPDVSADAAPATGYVVYYNGSYYYVGGTSAAAPVWAGLIALIDASGDGTCAASTPLGFLNPDLYAIAAGSGYADAFDDITSGANSTSGGSAYTATTGYDMATGLGTPIASGLAAQLCADSQGGGTGGGGSPAPPTVTYVSPADAAPGTTVTVAGSGFAAGATVEFGASAATSVAVDGTGELSATVPAGTGMVDVTVTTSAGESAASAADLFTYAPTETITSPAAAATYTEGQTVDADYACAASAPGAPTCVATTPLGDAIDTGRLGPAQFTVTATDSGGVSTSTSASYDVVPPPAVTLTSPGNGAVYLQGQRVAADYACSTTAPVTIASCSGPVANGAPVATTAAGTHRFTATATDSNGVEAEASSSYTVLAGPPALADLRQSATVWLEHAVHGSHIAVGDVFTFTLDRAASVKFRFVRSASGRLHGGRCVAPRAASRHARTCVRSLAAGSATLSARAGRARVPFAGRASAGTLAPGVYTVSVVATGADGEASAAARLRFTVATPASAHRAHGREG